ncbi:MAG: T9SS type A sorting domain-containing protein [Bacteroidota bacterium]
MKRILTLISLLLTVFAVNFDLNAAVITAISNGGTWSATTSWDLGRAPACGDTIIVPLGIEIKVTDNVDLDASTDACGAVRISVAGRLRFSNGKKIRLAPGACMNVENGGIIQPSAKGGGASENISIDGTRVWEASEGPLNGPFTMGCLVVLPVTLVAFEVSNEASSFNVDWYVNSENELAYYEVYVSKNGYNWELIHMQMARNTNEESHYGVRYQLQDIATDYVYFKLTSTNFNGSKQMLAMSTTPYEFKPEDTDQLVLIPNPVQTNSLTIIAFELENDEEYEVTAIDNFGKVVVQNKMNGNKGANTFVIENDRLKAGIYTIQVKNAEKMTSSKLIVL